MKSHLSSKPNLQSALSLTSLSLISATFFGSTIWLASESISAQDFPLTPPTTSPVTPPSTPTPTTIPTPYPSPTPIPSPTPTPTPTPSPERNPIVIRAIKPATGVVGKPLTLKLKLSQRGQTTFTTYLANLPPTNLPIETGCAHKPAGFFTLATCTTTFTPSQSGEYHVSATITNSQGHTRIITIPVSIRSKKLKPASDFGSIIRDQVTTQSDR